MNRVPDRSPAGPGRRHDGDRRVELRRSMATRCCASWPPTRSRWRRWSRDAAWGAPSSCPGLPLRVRRRGRGLRVSRDQARCLPAGPGRTRPAAARRRTGGAPAPDRAGPVGQRGPAGGPGHRALRLPAAGRRARLVPPAPAAALRARAADGGRGPAAPGPGSWPRWKALCGRWRRPTSTTSFRATTATRASRPSWPAAMTGRDRPARGREEILAAAAALFDRHGHHGTGMRTLARATGRGPANFDNCFTAKDDLARPAPRRA